MTDIVFGFCMGIIVVILMRPMVQDKAGFYELPDPEPPKKLEVSGTHLSCKKRS